MTKPLSKRQLKKKVANDRYLRQAKKLRETNAFGDLFKASKGVDLRYSPDKWSPSVKARITRYAKELGPLLASPTKAKRYYRKDHLALAIEASSQERKLPGQKAALFQVDKPDEQITITFDRKHRIKVKRGKVEQIRFHFDMDAFARDPEKELARVLEAAPGKFFKFITGANQSKTTYNKSDLKAELTRYIRRYDPTETDIGEFMYGVIGFPGLTAKEAVRRDVLHAEQVQQRQHERLRELSRTKRAYTKAEQRGMRTKGRRGRVR